jgi:hypothetical protein
VNVDVEAIHSSSAGGASAHREYAPRPFQPGKEPLIFHTWPVRTALPCPPCLGARRASTSYTNNNNWRSTTSIAQNDSHKEQTAGTPPKR